MTAILPADAAFTAPFAGVELAFVDDTNFGSTGRNANLPDYSDFIVLKVPGLR